jgi:hypothetical protein
MKNTKKNKKRESFHAKTIHGKRLGITLLDKIRTNKFIIPILIFCWPLVCFYKLIIPDIDESRVIGNDFYCLYYSYKLYLLDKLSHFTLPLWSPSEATGYPFYCNPFAQAFYPLNIFLVIFYKIFGGYSYADHQTFAVLGISIFALGTFFWLKSLNLNIRGIIFATCTIAISFKIAELVRFPNAVHTAAWLPWILFSITQIFKSNSYKTAIVNGLILTIAVIMMLTGGYPYYIVYSVFLFGPYLILFIVPQICKRVIGNFTVNLKIALPCIMGSFTIAVAVCAPYLLKMSQMLKMTVDRSGGSFAYSTEHIFNLIDTIGSLIFPPSSQTEGWYYFGMIGLLLIVIYLIDGILNLFVPSLRGSKNINRLDSTETKEECWFKSIWLFWFSVITYITYGASSLLFIFLWKHIHVFSSLRSWGRMNIILLPLLSWMLAKAYGHFEKIISGNKSFVKRTNLEKWMYPTIFFSIYLSIFLTQQYLYKNKLFDNYWVEYFPHLHSQEILFIKYGIFAFIALVIFITISYWTRIASGKILTGITAGFILFSSLDLKMRDTFWSYKKNPPTFRGKLNVDNLNQQSFSIPRTDYSNTIILGPAFNVGIVGNWYYSHYIDFLDMAKIDPGAKQELLGVINGKKLYFSSKIKHNTVRQFLDDAKRSQLKEKILSYNGDKLVVEVSADTDGYLSFIDNWDPDWEAKVDGDPVPIERLFDTFKSVRMSAGQHQVEFIYRPKF